MKGIKLDVKLMKPSTVQDTRCRLLQRQGMGKTKKIHTKIAQGQIKKNIPKSEIANTRRNKPMPSERTPQNRTTGTEESMTYQQPMEWRIVPAERNHWVYQDPIMPLAEGRPLSPLHPTRGCRLPAGKHGHRRVVTMKGNETRIAPPLPPSGYRGCTAPSRHKSTHYSTQTPTLPQPTPPRRTMTLVRHRRLAKS